MAFSVNKIILLGTLGKDAETRFTTTNLAVTSFSVATEHSYKEKSGDWKKETTWHNVTAFSLSDFMKDALIKGAKVYVEGRIQKREYKDKDGVKRYSVDVMADTIIPLDKGKKQDKPETPDIQEDEDSSLPF